MAKPLHEAQEDIKAKKYAEALGKIKEAQGVDKKTPYDEHVINDMLAFVLIKTNDLPGAAKAMEAEIDDGMTPAGEVPQKIKALAEIHYQLKNYDKSIEFGNRAIKGGFADEGIKTIVGQSYYLKGDYKSAQKYEDNLVDQEIKAGETPKNEQLMLLYSACQKANDDACTEKALEKMVTYYPKPESWAQLLFNVRRQVSGNEANLMETYRLMFDTDVLKDPGDYSEMAGLCLEAAPRVRRRRSCSAASIATHSTTSAPRIAPSACWRPRRNAPRPTRAHSPSSSRRRTGPPRRQERRRRPRLPRLRAVRQGHRPAAEGALQGRSKDEPGTACCSAWRSSRPATRTTRSRPSNRSRAIRPLERLAGLWVLHAKSA